MTKITPLGKRLLVKRSKAQTTKGGIILPDAAQEKPREGEVVAVGADIEKETLSIGDRILFSSYAGNEVKDDSGDEEFLILTEDDVLGRLTNG